MCSLTAHSKIRKPKKKSLLFDKKSLIWQKKLSHCKICVFVKNNQFFVAYLDCQPFNFWCHKSDYFYSRKFVSCNKCEFKNYLNQLKFQSYRVTNKESYRVTGSPIKRVTELQNYRVTNKESYRDRELHCHQ